MSDIEDRKRPYVNQTHSTCTEDQIRGARLTAARHALSLDDLALLLDMLGLGTDPQV